MTDEPGPAAPREPGPTARRRRRRATSAVGPPAVRPAPSAQAAPREAEPASTPAKRAARKPRGDVAERGLRSIVGAGPSQLGVSGALRGRDVNRPTDDDLAEAERDVVIVRRHWKPPT